MIANVSRRVPLWIALPVAVVASFLAHAMASGPGGRAIDGDGLERAPVAETGLVPLVIGIAAATAVLAIVGRIRRRGTGVSAIWFGAFPVIAYLLQETAERALHAQLFPFPVVLEPGAALVVAVHAAFGLLTFLLVRAVQAVVRRTLGASGRTVTPVRDALVSAVRHLDQSPRWLPLVRDGPIRGPPLSVCA